MIAQMNVLHAIYSNKVILIFDAKFVYAIYSRAYISRHYGITPLKILIFNHQSHRNLE